MKKDAEVLRYMRERRKGTNQERAAARAGMSVKTARKYERTGRLPSQLKQPAPGGHAPIRLKRTGRGSSNS
jgi:hypothetical protein